MNIAEFGDIYLPSNIQATGGRPRTQTAGDTDADNVELRQVQRVDTYAPQNSEENGNGQDTRELQSSRDEYIPGPAVMRNALYNVSDVKTDASGRVVRVPEPVSVKLSNAGTSNKIADIMLSMGRKLLSIFRITV